MNYSKHLLIAIQLGMMVPAWADTAVIVNPRMAARLTSSDVRNIFLGNTKSFPDGSIAIPVTLKDGKARDDFFAQTLGKTETQYKAIWSRLMFTGTGQPPRELDSEDEIKKLISLNPNIIGFIDTNKLDQSVREVAK